MDGASLKSSEWMKNLQRIFQFASHSRLVLFLPARIVSFANSRQISWVFRFFYHFSCSSNNFDWLSPLLPTRALVAMSSTKLGIQFDGCVVILTKFLQNALQCIICFHVFSLWYQLLSSVPTLQSILASEKQKKKFSLWFCIKNLLKVCSFLLHHRTSISISRNDLKNFSK